MRTNIASSLQQLNSKVFIAHHNRNMRNIDEVYAFSVVHEGHPRVLQNTVHTLIHCTCTYTVHV